MIGERRCRLCWRFINGKQGKRIPRQRHRWRRIEKIGKSRSRYCGFVHWPESYALYGYANQSAIKIATSCHKSRNNNAHPPPRSGQCVHGPFSIFGKRTQSGAIPTTTAEKENANVRQERNRRA